jgi:hypothetical protein
VVEEAGRIVWRGVLDTHPEALSRALQRWGGKLAKIGLESGSRSVHGRVCRGRCGQEPASEIMEIDP